MQLPKLDDGVEYECTCDVPDSGIEQISSQTLRLHVVLLRLLSGVGSGHLVTTLFGSDKKWRAGVDHLRRDDIGSFCRGADWG